MNSGTHRAKVLVLSDLWVPFPGGAERLIFNIARDWQHRGMSVAAITGYEHAQQFDGPPVLVNLDMPLDAVGAGVIREAIAKAKPDVILTHHVYARAFRNELVTSNVPVVQIVLNGDRMPGATMAVFISEYVRRQTQSFEVDMTVTPMAMPDCVAETHGDAIGFIKPIPHKGVEFVYRLARALPERRFVILRGEWQELEIIRPADNIEFMEPVADIREFYERCRLVVVPSLSEDAGTVGQECAANGIPCLSSNAGGLPETNGGGIVLPTNRLGRWVRAIRNLDDRRLYEEAVERQHKYAAEVDHAGALERLANRVETIARWTV